MAKVRLFVRKTNIICVFSYLGGCFGEKLFTYRYGEECMCF